MRQDAYGPVTRFVRSWEWLNEVVWSDRALKSLAAIHAHISADSEANAHLVIDRILKRGDQLSTFLFRAARFLIRSAKIFAS